MNNEPRTDPVNGLHLECRNYMKLKMAELGVDATVSTAPPIAQSPYEVACFTCPHGTTFWAEPTSEQIAQWAKDGTP